MTIRLIIAEVEEEIIFWTKCKDENRNELDNIEMSEVDRKLSWLAMRLALLQQMESETPVVTLEQKMKSLLASKMDAAEK